jgi:hypothetical protein
MTCDWPFCKRDAEWMAAYTTYDGFAALKSYCADHLARMETLRHDPRWTVDKWRLLDQLAGRASEARTERSR